MANEQLKALVRFAPRAASDDEFARLAARSGPPPSLRPSGPPANPAKAGRKLRGGPASPLVSGGGLSRILPPTTLGESRTSPRIGELLIGPGKRGF